METLFAFEVKAALKGRISHQILTHDMSSHWGILAETFPAASGRL